MHTPGSAVNGQASPRPDGFLVGDGPGRPPIAQAVEWGCRKAAQSTGLQDVGQGGGDEAAAGRIVAACSRKGPAQQ